ncbi:MAG: hypothetical protein Q8Q31_02615 [Nanoarchaeota archaeon]|nr:hypothetical protein [Nanoarchaeota archaeon]
MSNRIFTSYVDAMLQAAETFKQLDPDYIVAPMLGSVPFIDAMAIVSQDFDISKVRYMPASSRICDVGKSIQRWYKGFLDDVVDSPHSFPKVMAIDEVVSGASVIRCLANVDEATQRKKRELRQDLVERSHSFENDVALGALRDIDILSENAYASQIAQIREKVLKGSYRDDTRSLHEDSRQIVDFIKGGFSQRLPYTTIGIEDSKKKDHRNLEYEQAKTAGRVIPVEIEKIITMDNPDYCPVRFETLPEPQGRGGYVRFSPKVKDYVLTPVYLGFLQSLARHVGKNPSDVVPATMARVFEANKYVPE